MKTILIIIGILLGVFLIPVLLPFVVPVLAFVGVYYLIRLLLGGKK